MKKHFLAACPTDSSVTLASINLTVYAACPTDNSVTLASIILTVYAACPTDNSVTLASIIVTVYPVQQMVLLHLRQHFNSVRIS